MSETGNKEAHKLSTEDTRPRKECALCAEREVKPGQRTSYGAVIYRIGDEHNGWFATLSPKTGGDSLTDFTIQLMPCLHLTHLSQMSAVPKLAEHYGIAFSRICGAMTSIMMKEEHLLANAEQKEKSAPLAVYGKTTTWTEKKEHLHLKIFQFRNDIGQPYTVDSSFGSKEVFGTGKDSFVKMRPVKKTMLSSERFNHLVQELAALLKNDRSP